MAEIVFFMLRDVISCLLRLPETRFQVTLLNVKTLGDKNEEIWRAYSKNMMDWLKA
ncbi:MAG: hypothetical protein KGY54_05570 [Oleiphilaceae bacterium]|nr:hypothetical protein [Oleiphilaceae bacterium]